MKRRNFLASAATLPFALRNTPVHVASSPLFGALGATESDRVLVLINLIGGNDGLNTLVPLDQYDKLAQLRANVIVPEGSLVDVDGLRAFHPAFAKMRDLWQAGELGMVQDVGYPDQNRSHFRSQDIWNTASASDEVLTTGWIGRYLDGEYPNFPDGYPNTETPDPVAVTLGNAISETCQGVMGNFGLTVNNPSNAGTIRDTAGGPPPATPYGDELTFVREAIAQANAYGQVVSAAADRGDNLVDYPADSKFAEQLSYVAKMISGGLATKVYVVSLGGFDTHANQVESGDTTAGEHAALLRTLAEGVAAFQADIKALGLGERVIGMTYSEFGRRIRSNAARGTDHGTAAPAFLFGECVNAAVLGANPDIDLGVDEQEGVAMQYNFRDLYGSVLENWFGVAPATIRALLYDGYTRLPVIRDCSGVISDLAEAPDDDAAFHAAPSPFVDAVRLTFSLRARGPVRLEAYDMRGARLETLFERRLPAGEQSVNVDARDYPRGPVIFRLQEGGRVRVLRTVRL